MVARVLVTVVVGVVCRTTVLAAQCPDGSPPPCRAPSAQPPAPTPSSVAVLYFDNLSSDSGDAYLAAGLTEAVTDRLGRIDRLVLKSRTAVQRFRGRPLDDPTALGRILGVEYLVSGSVRRLGRRVRVTAELNRAGTGVRVWGEAYERPADDLMSIEAELAEAIALAVGLRLAPAEQRTLAALPTRSSQAYDHYLRGNHLIAARNPAAVARAITEYQAAVRLDGKFARAVTHLAFAFVLFYEYEWPYGTVAPDSLLVWASALVDRALLLDTLNSDAWTVRGDILYYRYPRMIDSAITSYRRALNFDSRNGQAWHNYGLMQQYRGDTAGAAAAYRQALAVEPGRPVTLGTLARLAYAGRQFRESLRWIDSALAAEPGYPAAYIDRAKLSLALGDFANARRDLDAAVRLGAGDPEVLHEGLGLLDARTGDTIAAHRRVAELLRESTEHPLTSTAPLRAAMILIALGDSLEALHLLERRNPQDGSWWLALRMPEFDGIRTHPRFQRVLENSRAP